jgi:8-oxo-dGTP pyrophosphatase MutT (NUDIX family)
MAMRYLFWLLVHLLPRWIYVPLLRPYLPKAVCLFCYRNGKVLAVSRKTDASKYGLVGGKVDPGETEVEALLRESKEEAGIRVVNPKPVYVDVCIGETTYLCVTFEGDAIIGELHTDEKITVAWKDPHVLIAGPFGDYNRGLFKARGVPIT